MESSLGATLASLATRLRKSSSDLFHGSKEDLSSWPGEHGGQWLGGRRSSVGPELGERLRAGVPRCSRPSLITPPSHPKLLTNSSHFPAHHLHCAKHSWQDYDYRQKRFREKVSFGLVLNATAVTSRVVSRQMAGN